MDTKQKIDEILSETGKAVLGKQEVLSRILTAILAGGHILIDDIPGVGKTTIAVAFTHALGLDYKRMQFTPDVLPSDITGFSMYDKNSGEFRYMPGSAMTNLFLPMKSTVHRRRRSPRSWKSCRKESFPSTARPTPSRSPSSSWQRRTPTALLARRSSLIPRQTAS